MNTISGQYSEETKRIRVSPLLAARSLGSTSITAHTWGQVLHIPKSCSTLNWSV